MSRDGEACPETSSGQVCKKGRIQGDKTGSFPFFNSHFSEVFMGSLPRLPGLDRKRTSKAQAGCHSERSEESRLLVAMYKYRGRHTRIGLGEPSLDNCI